jgi:hypothetical protein
MKSGKIIIVIVMIIAGIVYTIRRKVKNRQQAKSADEIISLIRSNETHLKTLTNELVEQYDYRSCPEGFTFDKFITKIKTAASVENTQLNYIHALSSNSALLITTCTDTDYDVKMSGSMGAVKRVLNINYIIEFDKNKGRLMVYSDMERDGNVKGLKFTFANNLFKMMN